MSLTSQARRTDGEENLLQVLDKLGSCGLAAAARIREAGLPGRRQEGWRWSDLRTAVQSNTAIHLTHDHDHVDAGFEVGPVESGSSIITDLAEALSAIDPDVVVEGVQNIRRGAAVRGVVVKTGHTVLVEYVGAEEGLAAGCFNAVVKGGKLTRIVVQEGPADAIVLNQADIVVGPGGAYEQFTLAFGGKLVRLETKVSVWDQGRAVLNAAYLLGAGRHCDLTTTVTAEGPRGSDVEPNGSLCDQVVKGVARDGGRGVFQGKILVQRPAQKTEARQRHQALMLEPGAEIFAKPELQIYADDVQCAHGNTVGSLDEDALFYMRTRGIPEVQARAILVEAFLVEAIPEDLDPAIKTELLERIGGWLNER